MNKFGYAALAAVMLLAGTTSYAQTADGQTPATETGCDGQSGAAFGLCNAYCEAMDCDSDLPQATDEACARVLDGFHKITGSEIPLCSSSSHPVSGEPCTTANGSIDFDPSEGVSYGCPDDINYEFLWCTGTPLLWYCSNSTG